MSQTIKSYTFASDEAVAATIAELPHKYPMKLNRSDMETVIRALAYVAIHSDSDELSEDAGMLASDIASTLGVEWI